ncbi:MAG TPA: hypothetical protein DDW67_06625 [Elusimicrobia bacterium]|nr:hypothetical protein [Elusimicrobiota bacterium]
MNKIPARKKLLAAALGVLALAAGISAASAANYNWPGENYSACYELSHSLDAWSRTPDLICVDKNAGKARIKLLVKEMGGSRLVGEFNLDLLRGARDAEFNQDVFGVANPSNSVFNALEISFNGNRVFAMDGGPWHEYGTLSVGNNRFFYRLSPLTK